MTYYHKQIKLDPGLIREFLSSLREQPIEDLAHQKMIVKAIIDRIYLYDDHFLIMLNHSGRKAKAGKREVQEVEKYFNNISSTASYSGVPNETVAITTL